MATDLFSSLKIVVMSAKKSRKKGKTPPEMIAPRVPMNSKILSDDVVYENNDRKGAGGAFWLSGSAFRSTGTFPDLEIKGRVIYSLDSSFMGKPLCFGFN